MDTKRFDEKNLAKHKERCDMIEQLAIAEEENRKLGIRADKLEQRLESETRKAERRMRHIDLMGAALTERRNQLHERGERIAELEKQVADLRAELANAEVPTERERQILDMWPRFEDGEYVWFGDAVEAHHGGAISIEAIEFSRGKVCVKDAEDGDWGTSMCTMHPLKRPAPEVLDADGVPIKVGDTVWRHSGFAHGVVTSIDAGSLMGTVRYVNEGVEFRDAAKDLAHTRPDSWEQLEEDAGEDPFRYCKTVGKRLDTFDNAEVFKSADIVRRAKALAGAEVGE